MRKMFKTNILLIMFHMYIALSPFQGFLTIFLTIFDSHIYVGETNVIVPISLTMKLKSK